MLLENLKLIKKSKVYPKIDILFEKSELNAEIELLF